MFHVKIEDFFETAIYIFWNFGPCSYTVAPIAALAAVEPFVFSCVQIEDFFRDGYTYSGILVPAAIQWPLAALAAVEPFVFSCVKIEDFFETATYSGICPCSYTVATSRTSCSGTVRVFMRED